MCHSSCAQVPRLALDLSTRLGRSVSTEEAKAACRELDRCGENAEDEDVACLLGDCLFVPFHNAIFCPGWNLVPSQRTRLYSTHTSTFDVATSHPHVWSLCVVLVGSGERRKHTNVIGRDLSECTRAGVLSVCGEVSRGDVLVKGVRRDGRGNPCLCTLTLPASAIVATQRKRRLCQLVGVGDVHSWPCNRMNMLGGHVVSRVGRVRTST